MSVLKLLKNLGRPEGTREAMRMSYKKHFEQAKAGRVPTEDSPHAVGIYGALASRHIARGRPAPEPYLWA